MNTALRQGMIPQSSIGQPQAMLSMGNPSFSMQNQVPLGSQQQLGLTSVGMPQNMQTNPPMTILSGGVPTGALPRYPLQGAPMQGPLQQQRQMVPRPSQNGSHLNPAVPNASTSHIQPQLHTMPFPSNGMQTSLAGDNSIRRVPSQPQININPLSSTGTSSMNMGMNQQTAMPGQLRQVAGQQQNPHSLHQMRLQHQHQQQQQQQMIPQSNIDLMIRNQGPGGMSARMASAQGQVMGSLTQPPLGSAPLPVGMPPPHQNVFNGSMPPAQLSTSPRPTSTQGMPMSTPASSHAPIIRPRTSPDSSNALPYMGYSVSQFPSNTSARGIPSSPGPSSYPFVPATSPRMQLSVVSQTSPPGMMPSQIGNPANKTGFFPTPAQQQLDMTGADIYNPGFMPPPSTPNQLVQTSLQQPPLPPTSQSSSQPNPQQHRPPQLSPSPQQPVHQQQVGHQVPPDQNHGLPHAQPQGGLGGAPGGTPPQPPRGFPPPASSNFFAGGLTAAGRLPLSQQTQGSSLSSPSTQQQSQVAMTVSSRPPGSAMPPPPTASSSLPGPSTSPPPIGVEQTSSRGKVASGGSYVSNAPQNGKPTDDASGPSSSTYHNSQQEKQGLGLMRLLQFSGTLSSENPQKYNLSYWNDLIREYFTPKAIMRLTLWKDNQRIEAKPFEIGVPILPRFFLVTTQSGVKSMTLSLDSARERVYQTGHTIVECLGASWTYRYRNGYTVTLRGPLTAHVIATSRSPPGSNTGNNSDVMYKFDEFQFDANFHDKFIALESILGVRTVENLPPPTPMMMTAHSPSMQGAVIGSGAASQSQGNQHQADDDRRWEEPRMLIAHAFLPGVPVNSFGIPQATMRCLELAESITSMAELIQFAKESSNGPLDALKEFAIRLRESGAVLPSQPPAQPPLHGHPMNINPPFYHPPSAASSATLYSASASPSTTHSMPPGPTPIGSAVVSSPPNTTPSGVNSPGKPPPKIIPQQAQQPQQSQTSSLSSTSPAMSTASTTAAGTLKRKQTGDTTSPTIGNEQQPQKRMARKRGRTGTG